MKVAVGISGGVDSAVAALSLKDRGHEVVGVTMTLGRTDEAQSVAEAWSVAERLEIPLKVLDFSSVWHTQVLEYIRRTYLDGSTPNPCVRCNETVKFGLLPRAAFELGCDCFATGHYARISFKHRGTETQGRQTGRQSLCLCDSVFENEVRLLRAVDKSKDQSYFLYRVEPEILARTMFPLGELTKAEVRERARAFGFEAADRGDSQDFCGGDPMDIVGARPREGDIVRTDGKVLGTHRGFWNYTVGKRKGLGVGGGTPYYVVRLDAARNEVIVGFRDEAVRREFRISEPVWFRVDRSGELTVKVRSAGEPRGPVTVDGETVRCPDGIAGVAPGQSAVFYDGEEVVGGGIIMV